MSNVAEIAERSKIASEELSRLGTEDKNRILLEMAKKLDEKREIVMNANQIDVENAIQRNVRKALIDRLLLNNTRIDMMTGSLRELSGLKDYVGDVMEERTLKNGLCIVEKRVPFGVIGVIYESRPNVTSDVCGICMKSASAVILKGGSDAINTNKALVRILSEACPVKNAFQLVESTGQKTVHKMLQLEGRIDVIIPRGGENLIRFVRENSRIPVIETGTGNCHIYVDEGADIGDAMKIVINAKTQRPGVCNAAEKLIVHRNIAERMLPELAKRLRVAGVEIRGCENTAQIIKCKKADDMDWKTEYLDLIIAVRIVDGIDDAIAHINEYGSGHSEAILSKNQGNVDRFFDEIDAAVVYSNASTRFTDGHEFGLGTEIGISTQKLHARGPMGLKAMTTTKYLVTGSGSIRG